MIGVLKWFMRKVRKSSIALFLIIFVSTVTLFIAYSRYAEKMDVIREILSVAVNVHGSQKNNNNLFTPSTAGLVRDSRYTEKMDVIKEILSVPVTVDSSQRNNNNLFTPSTAGLVRDIVAPNISKQLQNSDNEKNNNKIENEFKKQWLRVQKHRVDWKQILAPCANNTVLGQTLPGWGKENETSLKTSYFDYIDVRPAGQFSRFYIRTKTKDGRNKTIGGDFWKVILIGPATVAATVFDHGNGSYEAVALIVDPGEYSLSAIVERSLCEGMKDPTPEFYTRLIDLMRRCMNREIRKGEEPGCCLTGKLPEIKISVLPSQDNAEKRIQAVLKSNCEKNCSFIWTGLGRWIKNEWKPFLSSDNHLFYSLSLLKQPKETIYLMGDSVTKDFGRSYYYDRKAYNVCSQIWKSCNVDYFHLYPSKSELHPHGIDSCGKTEYNELQKYGNATVEFKPQIILDGVKELFLQPGMKSSTSLLVINLNFHHSRMLPFARYKDFIGNLVYLLKNRRKLLGSEARVVWRTSTALNYRGIFNRAWSSKYLTSDRALLFEAYALSEMCKSGIDVLDCYPMSMATPLATDRVHFKPEIFFKAMDALTWYSLAGIHPRTTKMCLEP